MNFLGTLILILFTTTILGHFSARIGLPAVIGQLLAGVILGPALLGWVQTSHWLDIFSELGVMLLMFLAGLESDLSLLKRYFKPSVLVAVLGVIVPVAGTFLVGEVFDINLKENIFVAVIFAATSVSISVAVLKELGVLSGRAGATILGAAVVDDILAVLILSVMVSLMGTVKTGNQTPLGLMFLEQLAYFVGVFVLIRYVTPILMRAVKKLYIPFNTTLVALLLCLVMAYIAEMVGLSSVVGTFFAGIAIGQTKEQHKVDQAIQPVGYTIFIPVFFVSIGLNMTLTGFKDDFWLIIILTVVAIIGKLLGASWGAILSKFDKRDAFLVGTGMVSRGEMALIIAQLGYTSHLISDNYYSAIITVIILTTVIAPFLIKMAVTRKIN